MSPLDSPSPSRRAARGAVSEARAVVFAALALLMAMPAVARAQVDDHLACYRVRDQKTFARAEVTLDAAVAQFGLQACRVVGRAKELCVPTTSQVTAVDGGVLEVRDGDPVRYSRLCYKLKCPKVELTPELVADAFGDRTVEKFKATRLCTPAVLASAPVTSTTTTSTTTSMSTTTTVATLDDGFDGTELDMAWTVLHGDLATVEVAGGALRVTPTTGGGTNMWYNDGEGVLVYREVTGDFDVRTVLSTEDSDVPGAAPPPEYRLAGILARDPASSPGDRNTVHVALGSGSNAQATSYEYKSTDGSISDWMTTPTASPDGELRLVRAGDDVTMYWRAGSGDGWLAIHSVVRADLPATLQVGLMAYAASAPGRIRAAFDEIVFDVP